MTAMTANHTLQRALRYACTCGHEYLIAFSGERDRDAWFGAVRTAAEALGLTFVSGSESRFICVDCGDVHVRDDADERAFGS
jgi:hypothetical protein